jgi:hypothetical protein
LKLINNLARHLGNGLRGCWLRGGDAETLRHQVAGAQINDPAFHPGAANINTDH